MLHSRRDIPTKITLVSRENYFHHISHFTESPPKIPTDLREALFLLATKISFKNNKYGLYNLRKVHFSVLIALKIEIMFNVMLLYLLVWRTKT